jgi:hypothetical protein
LKLPLKVLLCKNTKIKGLLFLTKNLLNGEYKYFMGR